MRKIFAVVAALLLAACNPFAVMEGADEEISAFHTAFNANQWEAIWNEADDEFRTITPRAKFDETMNNMRAAMGEWQSGEQTGFNINTDNGRTTTEIIYNSTFANGTATETFLFVGEGEEMALLGWNIEQQTGAAAAAPAAEAPADATGKPAAPASAAPASAGQKPAAPAQNAPAGDVPPKPAG